MGRNLLVAPISVPGALLTTDVWGRMRDGKPRLRRDHPNNHSILNVPPLIAALALLPDPMREDKGGLVLPLRDKGYVIRTITFEVQFGKNDRAICTPLRLKVLHDNNEIDLTERLTRVATLFGTAGLPEAVKKDVDRYVQIVSEGVPRAELKDISARIAKRINSTIELSEMLEAPSENFVIQDVQEPPETITLSKLTADETKKRLVSHFRIDRSSKIRGAKIELFTKTNGTIYCENCAFSFEKKYGARGKGFIEVHHVQPLAALLPNVVTRLSDLMLLCSNCHRMVHRKAPLLMPADLKAITAA